MLRLAALRRAKRADLYPILRNAFITTSSDQVFTRRGVSRFSSRLIFGNPMILDLLHFTRKLYLDVRV